MTRILIGNPGRQHSDQLALALQTKNLLGLFLHGSPARPDIAAQLSTKRHKALLRYRIALVVIARAPRASRDVWAHALYARFGRMMAGKIEPGRYQAVIAYENSALAPFQRAKKAGLITILDAASVHHGWQERAGDGRRVAEQSAIKDAELALADHVLTCSSLARQSYLAAGVLPERCHVLGFGVDLAAFSPRSEKRLPGPARFLFVGALSPEKGADILADACARLHAEGHKFKLECVGTVDAGLAARLAPFGTITGKIAHAALAARYQSADCLIHPSRFDSFAAVVAESLACGTPAIVSDNTGARDMIREGETGWCLPTGDADALALRMAEIARNPELCQAMAPACRNEAEGWTWDQYRERAGALIAHLLEQD